MWEKDEGSQSAEVDKHASRPGGIPGQELLTSKGQKQRSQNVGISFITLKYKCTEFEDCVYDKIHSKTARWRRTILSEETTLMQGCHDSGFCSEFSC